MPPFWLTTLSALTTVPSSHSNWKSSGGEGAPPSSQAAPQVFFMGTHAAVLEPLMETCLTAPRPPVSVIVKEIHLPAPSKFITHVALP
jgi:hypothetical protein